MKTAQANDFIQKYSAALSKVFGVTDVSKQFSVTGPMEISLRRALMESAQFLQMISVMDVPQIKGQVVTVGNPGLFTGRTKDSRFRNRTAVDGNTYELVETDSCAVLTWEDLSVWANAGAPDEFFRLVNEFSTQAFALDMIRIGFNGVKVEGNTDPETYPNGEDVNIGWHEIAKRWKNGSQIITDNVTLGKGGDYPNVDAMGSDLVNTMIPSHIRNDPRLVFLVGSDLVAAEQYRLFGAASKPSEKIAAQLLPNTIAGKRAYVPPFMPGKRLAVTTLQNLQILTQAGTRKRKAEDVEDRKAFENKYWRMEGYALSDPNLYAAFDEGGVSIGEVEESSAIPDDEGEE